MNSNNTSQRDLFSKPMALSLSLRGSIPSFKNNKMMILPSRKDLLFQIAHGTFEGLVVAVKAFLSKRPMLITRPDYQSRMDEMTRSIESQLRCAFQTASAQTCPGSSIQSWIASSMPEDDCWTQIPEIVIQGELVEAGQEGATITIERI